MLIFASLFVPSMTKSELKTAYQAAKCCPSHTEHDKCAIVYLTGGPSTGFTCTEAKELYCNADSNNNIQVDDCEMCYGEHTDPDCMPAENVASIIVNSDSHTVLEEAVTAANLVATLQGSGPFTVFAPTDAAFTTALTDLGKTKAELLADVEATLTPILKHHVLSSEVLSSNLADGDEVTMLGGEKVTVTITNGEVFIGGAKVTTADVKARNGVVHVIDKVLVPASLSEDSGDLGQSLGGGGGRQADASFEICTKDKVTEAGNDSDKLAEIKENCEKIVCVMEHHGIQGDAGAWKVDTFNLYWDQFKTDFPTWIAADYAKIGDKDDEGTCYDD